MKTIKIVSDGMPFGTHVFTSDGVEINDSIISITISKIEGGSVLKATVEFLAPRLELHAQMVAAHEVEKLIRTPPPPPDTGGVRGSALPNWIRRWLTA